VQCEYDNDEDDLAWLRTKTAVALKLTPEQLEDAIDTLDKSSHADLQSGESGRHGRRRAVAAPLAQAQAQAQAASVIRQ
jgi:hypothetical protein